MQKIEIVTTPKRLKEVSNLILQTSAVAVDTEFFWERTFYPILGLVQIATADGACWLVDAVTMPDISDLAPLLESESLVKVLHDAPQDLGILAQATGAAPHQIFDTRVAAGFAGFDSTCSLQSLLRETLKIEISKDETRSNWLRRPLHENQLRYAADDVLHLLPLREHLIQACSSDTVRGWLAEECAQLNKPEVYQERDPRMMYLRVKGSSRLNARQLAVLREITAWREEVAHQRDWPRGHVLRDPILIEIAQMAPTDVVDLMNLPDFPQRMPAEVVAALMDAVERGSELPDELCPQPDEITFATRRSLQSGAKRLLSQIRNRCAKYGIDPALVASRSDVESFLVHDHNSDQPHRLTQGWRKILLEGVDSSKGTTQ
ncbi:MAG: HRDC domain-containing protein [Kiritimatiellae bacterium]|nr:HRDC domain-containing protein [Kiritimatiellia bacterium]